MIRRLLDIAPPRTITAVAMVMHALGLPIVFGTAVTLRNPVYWYGLVLYSFGGPCAIVSAKRGAYQAESAACYLEASVLFAGTLAAIVEPTAPTEWVWWDMCAATFMFLALIMRAQVVSYLWREKESAVTQTHNDRIAELKKTG